MIRFVTRKHYTNTTGFCMCRRSYPCSLEGSLVLGRQLSSFTCVDCDIQATSIRQANSSWRSIGSLAILFMSGDERTVVSLLSSEALLHQMLELQTKMQSMNESFDKAISSPVYSPRCSATVPPVTLTHTHTAVFIKPPSLHISQHCTIASCQTAQSSTEYPHFPAVPLSTTHIPIICI